MSVTGIIAEFNPLHNGHKLLIDEAKKDGSSVVAVISGNFVQRGDTAILPKLKRAEAALRCGVDLVAELPVPWSMSTAQSFALGGVSQLMKLNCDKILFGSECGDIELLLSAADILESEKFKEYLSEELKKVITFAAAREAAAKRAGLTSGVLSGANDNLGIEYILNARKLGFNGEFLCIKRQGAAHDSDELHPTAVSASLIREQLLNGKIGFAERYMPKEIRGIINENSLSDITLLEKAILATLRTKSEAELKSLPDLSEGIENKLFFSIRVAKGLDELYNMVKTKRYTLARVRRLVLSAFLGLDSSLFNTIPPYVRILGFSKKGEQILRELESTAPVITRATQIKELDLLAQKVFETECRATDLYSLSLKTPQECGTEYKAKLLKTECLV